MKESVVNLEIKYNEEMKKHTSFKTGGKADYYAVAKNEEEIKEVKKFAKEKKLQMYVIGNGSNLLVRDRGYRGIILKIELENILIEEEKEAIIVTVGAGVKIMRLAQILKEKEITGFEEFAGIPGTIGGANRMNAGAYGKEIKDILIETRCMDENGNIKILKNDEQELEYRGSIFKKNKYIILESKLKFQKGKKEEIEKKMNEYTNQRKEKQPIEYPSAGSTFKRGEKFITAKLIDECALKGYSIGGAQISEKHAGFIVNKGNATSKDIIDLIEYTKQKVFEKFNVKIEEEIEIIGE